MKANKELRKVFDNTMANMFSHIQHQKTYLFYAHMIGQCSVKIFSGSSSPAGVAFNQDHYDLYINPTEFDILPLEQRLGVLKHEMLHILNGHVKRQGEREHKTWNYATDCAINQLIEREHLPVYGVFPENLIKGGVPENETSETYYEYLKQDQKQNPQQQQDKCPNCGGSGECDNSGNEYQDSNGSGQGEESNECPTCKGSGQSQEAGEGQPRPIDDHSMWGKSQGNEDLQKDITKNMIEKSISETQKSRGNIPNQISSYLELHSRKSEVNWKKVLKGIVGNKKVGKRSTIMRRDRRMPHRSDLRGKTKDRMFNLLVVSDVSGSVSDEALLSLWGEVRHICDVTKTAVDLIQVDTNPMEPEKLDKKTKIVDRKACGGTVLAPAIEMAEKHNIDYQAVVVTTDGYISESDVEAYKRTGRKVIWLIEKDGRILDSMQDGKMKAFQLKE